MTDSAKLSRKCDDALARHTLLAHPFYVAWNAGTLPVEALREYAREYGAFVRTIGKGWEAVGERGIARIEEGHARLWERSFAASLGTAVAAPEVGEVAALVETAGKLFSERVTALGALYAFEAQQPATAESKLRGLREHYWHLPNRCGQYFEAHEHDDAEPAILAKALDALPETARPRALDACDRMGRALWDALSGIHARHVAGRRQAAS